MIQQLGGKIGEGGCSEVFEWEDGGKIVKLAKPNTDINALETELHNCRMAWERGLPVPRPYDLVYFEGRPGIVFERVYGEPIINRFIASLQEQPNQFQKKEAYEDILDACMTARLLHQIHTHTSADMPSQRANIKHDIWRAPYLPDVDKAAVIAQLDRLPMKLQLCHGDPNPGNILIRDNGSVVIDWSNASAGNPEADLAEYVIMVRYAILPTHWPPEANRMLDAARETIIGRFMEEYERLSGIGLDEVEPWIAPLAARKLAADGISEEEKKLLIDEIRRRLP